MLKRVTQIKTHSWDNTQVVLVANKSDMQEDRVVSKERGAQLAKQLGTLYIVTLSSLIFFIYSFP
jgi:Ras-related protein Rab-3C